MARILDGADTGHEVKHVADEDEKKDGHEEREEFSSHLSALKRLGHIVINEHERLFEKRLEPPGNHRKAAPDEEREPDQECNDYPAGNECICDRNTYKFSQFFGRKRDVNTRLLRLAHMFKTRFDGHRWRNRSINSAHFHPFSYFSYDTLFPSAE